MAEQDLFEVYETLPQAVQDILLEFGDERGHDEGVEFKRQLEEHGYTCSFCLSGEPLNLRRHG